MLDFHIKASLNKQLYFQLFHKPKTKHLTLSVILSARATKDYKRKTFPPLKMGLQVKKKYLFLRDNHSILIKI